MPIACTECNDFEGTLTALHRDPSRKQVKRVLGTVRGHILDFPTHRNIRQRTAMFEIGIGLLDVTTRTIQHPHKLLHHPHRVIALRNVAVVVRFIR